MIQIKKGSTRLVLVLFNSFVLKFPRCYGMAAAARKTIIKIVWKREGFVSVWKGGLIGNLLRSILMSFLDGISANTREGFTWLSGKPSFLQPTLCLVICNIQRHGGDRIPTTEQLKSFSESLPEEGKRCLAYIDPHQHQADNWRIIDGRLRLIDYGGKISDSVSFTYLLGKWSKELEEGLSKPVTR